MTDIRNNHEEMRGVTPLVGFALGAVVGAGIALLLAPESGQKTRERLGRVARRVGSEARDRLEHARDAATGLGSDVKSAIDAGREAFHHDGKPQDSRTASRMTQSSATRDNT